MIKEAVNDYTVRLKAREISAVLYVAYALIILIFHLLISELFSDDPLIISLYKDDPIWVVIPPRYMVWSSRFFIDTVMILLVKHSFLLWKIINCIMMLTMPIFINRTVKGGTITSTMTMLMLLLYPAADIGETGWIGTSTNYLWPVWCVVTVAFLLDRLYHRKGLPWYAWIAAAVFVMYGSCHPFAGIFMCGIFAYYVYYVWHDKRSMHKGALLLWAENILTLVIVFISPSNAIRFGSEIGTAFPNYANFTFLERVFIGIMHTMRMLVSSADMIFIVFSCILVACVWYVSRHWFKTLLATVPLLLVICFGFFRIWYVDVPYGGLFGIIGFLWEIPYGSPSYGLYLIYFVLMVLSIAFSLWVIFKDNMQMFVSMLLLCAVGLGSLVGMGLSPSVYASGDRTFIFLSYTMIYVAVLCLKKVLPFSNESFVRSDTQTSRFHAAYLGLSVVALFSLLNVINMFYIGWIR